jgi:hypothetical protein
MDISYPICRCSSLHLPQYPHIGSHSPNIFGLTPHKLPQYRTEDGLDRLAIIRRKLGQEFKGLGPSAPYFDAIN